MALHTQSVLPPYLPFLCPEDLRLLHVHLKKRGSSSRNRGSPDIQTHNSRSTLCRRYHQLFCGLHSESLVATMEGPQHLSKTTSKPPLKDLHLFKDLPYLPLLSQPCLESTQPSSSPCPKGESPTQHGEVPLTIPFLTLAECKTLEWHLLQRQLQLQWGLPAAFHRSQHAQSPMQCELCNKAQSLKIQKTLRTERLSILTRELIFFPEHARRLLGFHLQKHLIHLRWGLPEKIQKSIQLLLSSPGQQPLSWSSGAPPSLSISQPRAPEARGDGCVFSPMISQVPVPMPVFFVQAQAMLQSHIDSKSGQIHQGKVPDLVYSSWECRIPGVLAMASLPLQGQLLEQKAASEPDLHPKMLSCEPMALGLQPRSLSNTTTNHHKLFQTLPEEINGKLVTTSRHEYLAFLSGLPALYYVALSRVKYPASTNQSIIRDGAYTYYSSFKVCILAKLNFHLKKKVLEIQLGIPEGARKSRKQNAAVPENKSTQEFLQSKKHQGNTVFQKLPTPADPPPAPASEKQATELEATQHTHPESLKAVPPQDVAPWVSKHPQPVGGMTEAQVLCVQDQSSVSNPSQEEPGSPGKSKDSAHVPMLAGKKEDPEKLEAVGDYGGGDAGLGLSLATEEVQPLNFQAKVQRPDGILLNKIPQGSWRWIYGFHPVNVCQHGPQGHPHPRVLKSTPRGRESELDLPHRQAKPNGILSPERAPNNAQPAVAQASQGQPFPDQPTQDQPLQSPSCKM
ncbi:LOW QUALITY PROTEIN: protein SPATA31F1 [Thomomys bottae]